MGNRIPNWLSTQQSVVMARKVALAWSLLSNQQTHCKVLIVSSHGPESYHTLDTIFTVSLYYYRQVSNIRRTLVCNQIVDHSDVVGASPVGAAPTTSSFST